jgi:hypothetical protein
MNFVELASHEAFDGEHRVLRIGHRLTLRSLAHHSLTAFRKCDNRRRRARAFRIFQNYRVATLHHSHAGICGAQIDT